MLNDPRLIDLKAKIEHGETSSVKAMLLAYLRDNPDSADAWWLLLCAADTEADRIMWLQKALSLDPNHAAAKLDYAPRQSSPSVASVSIFPVHTPPPLVAADAILHGMFRF
ncbi:MAG: hypothetical protein HY862_13585 [Chloroflexi bacterium]|nr:hypothetical protein [Chloroflexota bacterium]